MSLFGISQDQHRQQRHSNAQFLDEGGHSDAGESMSGDDEAEAARELGLLHEAKCFCCSGHSKYVCEALFQNGLAYARLQRVVVH